MLGILGSVFLTLNDTTWENWNRTKESQCLIVQRKSEQMLGIICSCANICLKMFRSSSTLHLRINLQVFELITHKLLFLSIMKSFKHSQCKLEKVCEPLKAPDINKT